jgi:peptidylprolyl isomerase
MARLLAVPDPPRRTTCSFLARSSRLAPLLVSALLLLPACGSKSGDEVTAVEPGTSASATPTVRVTDPNAKFPELTAGKAFGEEPTISITGDPPPDVRVKTLSEGDGPAVKAKDIVGANIKAQVWGSAQEAQSSFATGPQLLPLGKDELPAGLEAKLPGVKVGSRVLIVQTPDADDEEATAPTIVFVIDVLDAFAGDTAASGDKVTPDSALPAVTGEKDPKIATPKGDPSSKLVDQVLIKGTGRELVTGDTAVVNYTGVLWRNGEQFDSSWDREGGPSPLSFQIGTEGIIKAWNEGLAGKKIGSRVLLVVPPDKGYGPEGNSAAGIKGDDTLLFVIDIVGALPAPKATGAAPSPSASAS